MASGLAGEDVDEDVIEDDDADAGRLSLRKMGSRSLERRKFMVHPGSTADGSKVMQRCGNMSLPMALSIGHNLP